MIIVSSIDLNLYRFFLAVADCRNISKASKKLYVSQPAVTKSIKNLESSLNTKLFLRKHGGVELTESGKKLYHYIKTASSFVQTAETMISKSDNIETIKIGIANYIPVKIIEKSIRHFLTLQKNTTISIIVEDDDTLIKMLENNLVNLIICSYIPTDDKKELVCIELNDMETCFVGGKRYKDMLANAPISIPDLKKEKLLLFNQNNYFRLLLEEELNYTDSSFNTIIEANSLELLVYFIKKNYGIGFCPKRMIEDYLKNGEMFELFTNITVPKIHVRLLYSPNYITSGSMKLVDSFKVGKKEISKELNLLSSTDNNIKLSVQEFIFFYNTINEMRKIKKVNLYRSAFNKYELLEYLKRLNNENINSCLTYEESDFDNTFVDAVQYCKSIILHTTYDSLNYYDNKIFYNNINLVNLIKRYPKINILLSIDVSKNINIKLKEVIRIANYLNVNIKLNEIGLTDKYTLTNVENYLKKYNYIQAYQDVNIRCFSKNRHKIFIQRHFCSVAKNKNNTCEFCNEYKDINFTLDGKLLLCNQSNKSINLYNSLLRKDFVELKKFFNNYLESIGLICE